MYRFFTLCFMELERMKRLKTGPKLMPRVNIFVQERQASQRFDVTL